MDWVKVVIFEKEICIGPNAGGKLYVFTIYS